MDETSSETLTSAATTNDTDNKSGKDKGRKSETKETSSGLSKNDMEGETKLDIESNEENKSPGSKNLDLTKNEDKSELKISDEAIVDKDNDNDSDSDTTKESVPNEVDEICQKHSTQNEIRDEANKELEVSKEKEEEKVQSNVLNESCSDESSGLVTDKSNGNDNNENCFHDVDKNGDNEDKNTNNVSPREKKVAKINDNDELARGKNKPNTSEEHAKCSPSTSTPSFQNKCDKTEVPDKVNDKDQSNDISSKMQITLCLKLQLFAFYLKYRLIDLYH
jgi:hypothetical protein